MERDGSGNGPRSLETRRTPDGLESELQALRDSSHPLALEFLQAFRDPVRIIARLLEENQRLRRELEELKGSRAAPPVPASRWAPFFSAPDRPKETGPPAARRPAPRSRATPLPAFCLQVQARGRTGGCEMQFVEEVAQLLAAQGVSLQKEAYRPDSPHPLLLFCPVVSRVGADIENALEGLSAACRVLLVMLHHLPKEHFQLLATSKRHACHPALLDVVDACFSMQSGFYHCQTNVAAVNAVATTLQRLALGPR